jgi:hypothetical protein
MFLGLKWSNLMKRHNIQPAIDDPIDSVKVEEAVRGG